TQSDVHGIPASASPVSAAAAPLPQLSAKRAAVATSHPEAARAARQILEGGGNAIDAIVAAVAALCVVTPSQVSLGGYGGSMVVYLGKEEKPAAIGFDSRAPLADRDELFATGIKKRSHYRGPSGSGPG